MRKSLKDRFIEKYPQIHLKSNFPTGGFITPHGSVITAYGNHEAMAQTVRGTLRGLIQVGLVRFHVYQGTIGLDVPKHITEAQLITISRILKDCKPDIFLVCRNSETAWTCEPYRHKQTMDYLRRTNET